MVPVPQPQDCRVFVGNMDWGVTWQELKDHMRVVGEVKHVEILVKPNGMSRGCGIVQFDTADSASRACQELNDSELRGRPIFVREDRESSMEIGRGGNYLFKMNGKGKGKGMWGGWGWGWAPMMPPPPPFKGGKGYYSYKGGKGGYGSGKGYDGGWGQDYDEGYGGKGKGFGFGFGFGGKGKGGFDDGKGKGKGWYSYGPEAAAGGWYMPMPPPMWGKGKGFFGKGKGISPLRVRPEDKGRLLYVGNLPWKGQWQEVKDLFRQYGPVIRVDIAEDFNGFSRGYCTVLFEDTDSADAALKALDGHDFQGRELRVRYDNKI